MESNSEPMEPLVVLNLDGRRSVRAIFKGEFERPSHASPDHHHHHYEFNQSNAMFLRPLRQSLQQTSRHLRFSSTYNLINPSSPRPRVAMIELNRPKALNALSSPLMNELNTHLESLDKDTEIGAIVLTGGVKVFAGIPVSFPPIVLNCVSWCRYQRVESLRSRVTVE